MSKKSVPGKFSASSLKDFLDEKVDLYNRATFIDADPVSLPHRYTSKDDIEISGFLTATISWGRRPLILASASKLFQLMDDQPAAFIREAGKSDLKRFENFVYRTFNAFDLVYFIKALQHLYRKGESLETLFRDAYEVTGGDVGKTINMARSQFFRFSDPGRTSKHFSDPMANAAAKRVNMFLRWMVRKDKRGVDFGIWKNIPSSSLCCPLDVHSGRVARTLGLLSRKQDDWKAVMELTTNLRNLDPRDPVKYDYALFGLGVEEKF